MPHTYDPFGAMHGLYEDDRSIEEQTLVEDQDPFVQFARWFEEAKTSEPNDANAMALATVDADGLPDARMVLLKGADAEGFVFYTNTESAKGRQLQSSGKAALLFHWKSLRRQVRARGSIERVSDAEADAYFATRARGSQVGAWASDQSRPLEDRFAFERRLADLGFKFGMDPVPRPPHWTGYRLTPSSMEFWVDGPFRLHDRLAFNRESPQDRWSTTWLYP
jgi:pyridoxamine 5'-phosphate oxidase